MFTFTSSQIWESIETSLKESYSILQFKKKYSQILLISQKYYKISFSKARMTHGL